MVDSTLEMVELLLPLLFGDLLSQAEQSLTSTLMDARLMNYVNNQPDI